MGNEYAYAWNRPLVVGDPLGLQAPNVRQGQFEYDPREDLGESSFDVESRRPGRPDEGLSVTLTNATGEPVVVRPDEITVPANATVRIRFELEEVVEVWSGYRCKADVYTWRMVSRKLHSQQATSLQVGGTLWMGLSSFLPPPANVAVFAIGFTMFLYGVALGDRTTETEERDEDPFADCYWWTGRVTRTRRWVAKVERYLPGEIPMPLPGEYEVDAASDLGRRVGELAGEGGFTKTDQRDVSARLGSAGGPPGR